ncbi:MAG: hypothetical protein COB98_02325 [Flavobacteriaceae bacterium]|nr:MAG: hypothetical protein COB98_02325 [Flavobacteriaceae bacterium]
MKEDTIVCFENVSFSYPSGSLAIESLNVNLPKGKKIALLGGNGAGKSTLMLLLNGILKPSKGQLLYNGESYNYNAKALRTLRSNVGLLFPEPDYQLIAPTVYEEISFGLLNQVKEPEEIRKIIAKVLVDFSLVELKDRPPHQLSTGQKKRLCLAAVLAMEPELIVCDEPAANLDPMYADKIFNYLNTLNKKGKTILIATHDVNQAYEWADFIVILNEGKVLTSGGPETVFNCENTLKQANLKQPTIINIINSLGLDSVNVPRNIDGLNALLKGRLSK